MSDTNNLHPVPSNLNPVPFGLGDDGLGYLWERAHPVISPLGWAPSAIHPQLFDLLDEMVVTNNSLADHRDPDPAGRVKWYASKELAEAALIRAALKLKAQLAERRS